MNEVSEISRQKFKLSKEAINRIKFLLKNEKGCLLYTSDAADE